ncbi:MAG: folate-binding protein [Propionibacteriaceae bacterium]|nr:folate-binding protein [Propionibacteriaceae bacterium]
MTKVLITDGTDAGLAWHYGDPLGEQRLLEEAGGVVELSNREVIRIDGDDRLKLVNLLSTQALDSLAIGESASTYLLDPQGHIVHFLALVNDEETLWGWTEPGRGRALADHLNSMRFRLDVRAELVDQMTILWSGVPRDNTVMRSGTPNCLGGYELFVPRDSHSLDPTVGLWAYTARRVAAGVPRIGTDTDERTIPNELGVPSECVSLNKGCYPGQETVAKTHFRGTPPRRLVRLHFDGSQERFMSPGTPLTAVESDTPVGILGSMAYHMDLGPIALGLIARKITDSTLILADGVPATIQPLV